MHPCILHSSWLSNLEGVRRGHRRSDWFPQDCAAGVSDGIFKTSVTFPSHSSRPALLRHSCPLRSLIALGSQRFTHSCIQSSNPSETSSHQDNMFVQRRMRRHSHQQAVVPYSRFHGQASFDRVVREQTPSSSAPNWLTQDLNPTNDESKDPEQFQILKTHSDRRTYMPSAAQPVEAAGASNSAQGWLGFGNAPSEVQWEYLNGARIPGPSPAAVSHFNPQARPDGPKSVQPASCVCRICGITLSSSSNRYRHERLKHATDLAMEGVMMNSVSAGASRRQSSSTAFAAPTAAAGSSLNHQIQIDLTEEEKTASTSHAAASVTLTPLDGASALGIDRDLGGLEAVDAGLISSTTSASEDGSVESATTPMVDSDSEEQDEPQMSDAAPASVAVDGASDEQQSRNIESEPNPPAAAAASAAATVEYEPLNLSNVSGVRPLLQEEQLQKVCYPFLLWLADPPVTQCEALVKARRVKSLTQLQPIKCNLRFIFAVLFECNSIDAIELSAVTKLSICQALYQAMVVRQVSSGRIHAIFLLVKKLLVYLSSVESSKVRQFVQPTTFESFMYIDGICSDSSHQRKQEARNRMVLGLEGGRGALTQSQKFEIPRVWSSPPSSGSGQVPAAAMVQVGTAEQQPTAAAGLVTLVPQAAQPIIRTAVAPVTMTKEELQQVTRGCLQFLDVQMGRYLNEPQALGTSIATSEVDLHFMHYLVTVTLCLGMAPRNQVLQQLQMGSSLVKEADGLYWIRMRAEQSKNGQPTMFALAKQLTPAYDVYFQFVRPRLLAAAEERSRQRGGNAASSGTHNYVFFKRNGTAPRMDFSSSTNLVTKSILGRPINAHAFRSCIITTLYASGASQADLNLLARVMAHSPETQRNFYYKPQHSQAAVHMGQRLVDQLLQDPAAARLESSAVDKHST
jgi:hypothetical protein